MAKTPWPLGSVQTPPKPGAQGSNGPGISPLMPYTGPAVAGQNATGAQRAKKSDARFRSFAERYFVARAAFFRADPKQLAEDTWECLLDAKRAYGMIERMGREIDPEDDQF